MKLFQKLLVAPAALGLLAPAAVNASELNLNGVSDYAAIGEQVTSITQFSDVYPTDWAYQALDNLIQRYGCVAGYPNGTYRGNRAMTRFEAAALLNACLDRVTEITDELKRLMKEFEKELAILRGRVDGLEAKVGELEATQFSTTTRLKGDSSFVIGANSFGGTQNGPFFDQPEKFIGNDVDVVFLDDSGDPSERGTPVLVKDGEIVELDGKAVALPAGIPDAVRFKYPSRNRRRYGATVFNYDLRLNL